jgi:hypothetical protein
MYLFHHGHESWLMIYVGKKNDKQEKIVHNDPLIPNKRTISFVVIYC